MTDTALRSPPDDPAPPRRRFAGLRAARRTDRLWLLAVLAALIASVVLRFTAFSPLWLDEAQSVSIARLPLTSGHGTTMWTGLRQDGSPPLYYLLLHGWISLFGISGGAVRALSALLNLASVPPLYLLARRTVGERPARVVVVLFLTSPFAMYFATETRMYSLLVLLAVLGGLALERTLRAPRWWSVLAVAACSGGLALTHYWCFYLLGTVAVWLGWRSLRRPRGVSPDRRRTARVALGGLVGGAVFFAPWVGEFLYQKKHTGTPWGEPASYAAVVHAYGQWAGGPTSTGRLLLVLLTALVAFGIAGRPLDSRRVELDLRGRQPGLALFALSVATLVVAVTAGLVVGNAWADRYTATAFVPFLLAVGLGTSSLLGRRTFQAVVLAIAVLGVWAGAGEVLATRTQARQVASALDRLASPGDVLLVCPDQLGPGLSREIPSWLRAYSVPAYTPLDRVDWVDYAQRQQDANPAAIAARAVAEAGPTHRIFIAESGDYRTYETLCNSVQGAIQASRPGGSIVVEQAKPARIYENYQLVRFPAVAVRGAAGAIHPVR